MGAFIIIFIITILSVMYVDRLVKIKFIDEKRNGWKIIHIVAYIIVFIPWIGVTYLVSDGNFIEIGLLISLCTLVCNLKNSST